MPALLNLEVEVINIDGCLILLYGPKSDLRGHVYRNL